MNAPLHIVYVEDNPIDVELVTELLGSSGFTCDIRVVETLEAFAKALADATPDIIFSDYSLPSYSGMEALKDARRLAPDVPFIFVSGTIGEENAIESLRNGATDYVLKQNLSRLPPVLKRALAEREEHRTRKQMEERIRQSEKRFSAFMKHMPGVAFMKDKDRRYVFINDAAQRYIDRESIECLGRRDEEILPGYVADAMIAADARVLSTGEIQQVIEEIDLTGSIRKWLVTRFPIADKYGTTNWIGGVGIDITDGTRSGDGE